MWEKDQAMFITKTGRVARRQEAEYRLSTTFRKEYRIIKTVMKGRNLYGAVEDTRTSDVFGCVLTLDTENGMVYWRVETEDVGPVEGGCPDSILALLTPTDSKWANKWRQRK